MPRLSVVMPSYQHERFLPAAIDSVLGQEWADLELLIVDDASSDGSAEIIRAYERKDPRVRGLIHAENQGIARTFNDALALAQAPFVAILASDDLWLGSKLKRQMPAVEAYPDHVVWSEALLVDAEGRSLGLTFTQMCHAERRRKSGNILTDLLRSNYLFFSSLVARTEILRGLGFDEGLKYANDVKLGLELARRHEFLWLAEPLACHRRHGANASLMLDRESWAADAQRLAEYQRHELGDLLDADPELAESAAAYLRLLSGGAWA
jgi:glycosyltransferase involved in cell wall biosynthesis